MVQVWYNLFNFEPGQKCRRRCYHVSWRSWKDCIGRKYRWSSRVCVAGSLDAYWYGHSFASKSEHLLINMYNQAPRKILQVFRKTASPRSTLCSPSYSVQWKEVRNRTSLLNSCRGRLSLSYVSFSGSNKLWCRYDKSAGNIVESSLWATIGQVPWADPPTSWYHMFPSFPFQAIREAAEKGEYTITDKGTWLAVKDEIRKNLKVFVKSLPQYQSFENIH